MSVLVSLPRPGKAAFTIDGATKNGEFASFVNFYDSGTAAESNFTINGGRGQDAVGAVMTFLAHSTAANATIRINGGRKGGAGASLIFQDNSTGDAAVVKVSDNGQLDVGSDTRANFSLGSVEGSGWVFLGGRSVTVGSNNRSTSFSGVIQDGGMSDKTGGSLVKTGTGTLTLSGASTYTGGTTLNAGGLTIQNTTGSGTGTGVVQVNAGTLGGPGIIAGAVTVGTGRGAGAILQPSAGVSQPVTLTIQSALTFKADGTYTYKLSTQRVKGDQVAANGVTLASGAQFNFTAVANKRLAAGTVFTAMSNTGATPISGAFANLPDGSAISAGRNTFQVSYTGGDGNDLTLTVQ